ncbi:MAG: hypothetical protein U0835_15150 [Isosphaeraceae bacterium]
MELKRAPDATDFVVSADAAHAAVLEEKLGKLGRIEPVKGHPGRFIVTLDGDPESASARLKRSLRGLDFKPEVHPVLVDAQGNRVVPTGKVAVRFKTAPSADELHEFAAPLGLAVESRNDIIPSQVTFRLADRARRSMLDVIKTIEKKAAEVQRVWPETLGRYSRG